MRKRAVKLVLVGLVLAMLPTAFAGDFCLPTGDCYGGVIATLGGPPSKEVRDGMMDKVCGKGKWKIWRVDSQPKHKLPAQLANAKSLDFRFYCTPPVRFVPNKK